MNPDDPRHGTTPGYHAGCRLLCCRRAIARYEKATKHRRHNGVAWAIPALGTQRRIQALMALGWTSTDIAAECGWAHRNYVMRILNGQKGKPTTWVQRKTAEVFAAAYDQLSMQIPPHAPRRARTRAIAARKGYAPPLAWDDIDDPNETPTWGGRDSDLDPVIVMRLLEGRTVKANRAEREEAIRRWVEDGGTKTELCNIHGWAPDRYHVKTRLTVLRGGAA